MAVLPSAERDTAVPWLAFPTTPEPTSLSPYCVQTAPLLVQTHAAPTPPLSFFPPTRAVLPSAERDTEVPWSAGPAMPDPTSLVPCWLQTPPVLVQTHAAPALPQSLYPPTMAVLPSAERDTEPPWRAPDAPDPTSLVPCWLQTPPVLVQTHAAPALPLSFSPPTMAVLPSAERDTEEPCRAFPTAPEPTSLVPCWVQTPPLLVQTHAAPAPPLSIYPPTMAVLPSAERDTDPPCAAGPPPPAP